MRVPGSMDPLIARKTWLTGEVIHGMIYFAPEAAERYAALGFPSASEAPEADARPPSPWTARSDQMGYFASRGAALGRASAELVTATFFNFHPSLVRSAIPDAWEIATPADVLDARLDAADAALRRFIGHSLEGPAMEEAAALARRAAEAAAERPEGRPLFAAHASLPWPHPPHLVLWHAQTLLREFRGDGHVAALLVEGLSGLDALVIHGASGDVDPGVLQRTRAWPEDDWGAAVERLRGRGLLATGSGLALSDAGRRRRQWVEDRTDALAVCAYQSLGEDGCKRLRDLARPFSRAIIEAGGIPGVTRGIPQRGRDREGGRL